MLILNVSPPISVLIAEDNMINQKILSHFLKKKGITNTVASNGKQAVDKYRAGRFHLVLMDIVMPIMDGIEATREIRRIEAERRKVQKFSPEVVIVALTATSVPQDRYAALEAGCNDYLIKPVSL
ncbi:CheY-like protein, partial [Caulochytrium protostelioides]